MSVQTPLRLLTPRQVADMLGYRDHAKPLEAVRYLRRTGRLQAVKIGGRYRYRLRDVAALQEDLAG